MSEKMSVEQFLAIRKEEGLKIDPETAEVEWTYGEVLDPYGVGEPIPEDGHCVGRVRFARRPGSDVWVCFDDLPAKVAERLRERYQLAAIGVPRRAR